jgi:hypothetical protein
LAKPVPQMEEENVFITIEAIDGGRPALRTAQRVIIVWSLVLVGLLAISFL